MKAESPKHIAIIMDGNRRWAHQHSLPEIEGHRKGIDALINTVEEAGRLGVKYLTVYALSTENYQNRNKQEVKALLKLLEEGARKYIPRLKEEGVRLNVIGNIESLPTTTQLVIREVVRRLSAGKKGVLNVALNYGGREEIVSTAKRLAEENSEFTEDSFQKKLYTAKIPDPDLLIRTGGQWRLSNFLLWQLSYTELYFTDTLWPDFDGKKLRGVIKEFNDRKRNFGA